MITDNSTTEQLLRTIEVAAIIGLIQNEHILALSEASQDDEDTKARVLGELLQKISLFLTPTEGEH